MIRNLIFDFGGVLINLDLEAVPKGLLEFGMEMPGQGLLQVSQHYEKGLVNTREFLEGVSEVVQGSQISDVERIWNQTIADFPLQRLEFLERLKESGRFRMFLLSNTNELHMEEVQKTMGSTTYDRFCSCFDGFYLSHELGMRKPDREIFQFVLNKNTLLPEQTLFIDDTEEHIISASTLGIKTWHLKVGEEDILQLPDKLH
ncbi:MAG: HAD family phosphatase [Robiginitalea sp.]|jgi:FMN phosphatase YigB (HAD superfamily)